VTSRPLLRARVLDRFPGTAGTAEAPGTAPPDVAHQLAVRTQQIIESETNVGTVADPLGGSWYLEALTDELEVSEPSLPRRS
jgi:methylmalonyl-CoA mutase